MLAHLVVAVGSIDFFFAEVVYLCEILGKYCSLVRYGTLKEPINNFIYFFNKINKNRVMSVLDMTFWVYFLCVSVMICDKVMSKRISYAWEPISSNKWCNLRFIRNTVWETHSQSTCKAYPCVGWSSLNILLLHYTMTMIK